jgi:hypothetical protein
MSEKAIVSRFLIEASRKGARMFRNNTGMGWIGKAEFFKKQQFVKVLSGDVVIRHARALHAGLCKGSADTIGWTPITITEEMLGRKLAIFTAVEMKDDKGIVSQEQIDFIKSIQNDGGLACIAWSVEDGVELLQANVLRGKFLK